MKWNQADGDDIESSEMKDTHLINTIRMLRGQYDGAAFSTTGKLPKDFDTIFPIGEDDDNPLKYFVFIQEAKKRGLNYKCNRTSNMVKMADKEPSNFESKKYKAKAVYAFGYADPRGVFGSAPVKKEGSIFSVDRNK